MFQCGILFLLFSLLLLFPGAAHGQEQKVVPVVIFSWKSPTLIPSGYPGKAMPVYNSRVQVSADVFFGNSFVDPGLLLYHWSLSGSRLASGRGMHQTSFVVKTGPRTSNVISVEIDLPGGSTIEKNFFIPTAEPRVVITQQRPYNILKEGVNLFAARPFFFTAPSASSLSFNWLFNRSLVSSESALSDKFEVEILPQTTPGSSLSVGVEVKNPANPFEAASQNLSLRVQ